MTTLASIQLDTGHRLGQANALLILVTRSTPRERTPPSPTGGQALALFTEIGTPQADHADALVRAGAATAADYR